MTTTEAVPTRSCYFCSASPVLINSDGRRSVLLINGPHWTGTEWVRIDYCNECAGQIAKAPRRPRRPRPQQYPATDWNLLVLFNEARTGRNARRR